MTCIPFTEHADEPGSVIVPVMFKPAVIIRCTIIDPRQIMFRTFEFLIKFKSAAGKRINSLNVTIFRLQFRNANQGRQQTGLCGRRMHPVPCWGGGQ